jgi:hypothetical protein
LEGLGIAREIGTLLSKLDRRSNPPGLGQTELSKWSVGLHRFVLLSIALGIERLHINRISDQSLP